MRYGSKVQGWFTDPEGERLVELAKDAPGEIVELGTGWGKSASYILALTDRNMTCVDSWDESTAKIDPSCTGYAAFIDLLQENDWTSRVTVLRQRTQDAAKKWTKSIGLLHIDASHKYENVRADFEAWSPFIVPGGAIALHDQQEAGPSRVVEEFLLPDPRWVDRQTVYVQWSARLQPAKARRLP